MNENYKGDDTVGRLMHDFGCKQAKDMYYPELAKGVKHFKEEGGRERMCEAVEKYGDRRAESARLNNLLENVRNLMESMKWSAEQAMSAMKVSDADRAMLLEKLWVGADKIRTENERLCKRICRKVCGVKGRNCKT